MNIIKTLIGFPNKKKSKYPLNLQSLKITTNTGSIIHLNNHPQIIDQEAGYWLKVIEYTDDKRMDIYRRHVIYLYENVLDIEFRYDGENVLK